MNNPFEPRKLQCASHVLELSSPKVMGILNVTPDSFSDGGRYTHVDRALAHAERMLAEGAAIIDVGGESTRPGATPIAPAEELDRVAPVVERLVSELGALVSLDTSSAQVIRECGALGAGMVNDVRSLTRAGALQAAAATNMAVCVMHMQGEPQVMQDNPHYEGPVADAVVAFLKQRIMACETAGIARERLVVDPGFGFGKNLEHNLELMHELEQCQALDLPLLVGTSRKGMIGRVLADAQGNPRPVGESGQGRLYGGLALTVMAIERGARIIRTHDVGPTQDAIRQTWAVMNRTLSA